MTNIWQENSKIEYSNKNGATNVWHFIRPEIDNFCFNDLLQEYNLKLRLQTYKVEERTSGTPCILKLKLWLKFTEKNMGLLWQMCHY